MDRLRNLLPACWLIAALVLLCCSGEPPTSVSEKGSLFVDPGTQDFTENPALLERIVSSPHGYLRFVNIQFSDEVCHLFEDTLDEVPLFNLHGDAHVEQYAVTDLGRGLTDFDDSSTGPAILDIMRLAVSLRLAALANGWEDEADEFFDRFLAGYRAALEDPELEVPVPTVASRLAAGFEYDRETYFEWVESIVDTVPAEEAAALIDALEPYIEAMVAEHLETRREFFEVVDVGYLRLGIGSALDRKYLVRVRGVSDDFADDVVLELKQVRDLSNIDCISVMKKIDPQRILRGQSRIAYQPYQFLGYVRFDGLMFWSHAWVDNYSESSIEDSFRSPAELAEVAYDIGIQLGRGHPKLTESKLDFQLRREQIRFLDRDELRIKETARALTEQVVAAWEAFRLALS